MGFQDKEMFRLVNRYMNTDNYRKLSEEGQIPFDLHKLIKRKELHESLVNKTKVYMDLNFWINIRDCINKKRGGNLYQQLFEILKEKIRIGKLVCPFSNVLIEEIFKQNSKKSRMKTFQVADILSDKLLICHLYHIVMCELHNLISLYHDGKPTQFWYTWTRPINALGDFNLETDGEISADQLILKKVLYDINLQSSFQSVLREQDAANFINKDSSVWHAEMVNRSKSFHDVNGISKKKLQLLEIKSSYRSILKYLDLSSHVDMDLIVNKFNISKLRSLTPTCYAYSAIYTELTLDKTRKIKANDYYDIMHSSIALSTCNFFLTEKSFASTLKRMHIDKEFGLTVLYDVNEAIEIFSSI